MKVNSDKTRLLCVSNSLSTASSAFILDSDGNRLGSGDSLKMLGFHFGHKPTVNHHIEVLGKRFQQRNWILNHLKHAGFNTDELAKVYWTIVRPVADYMYVVYHSMLFDRLDGEVERLQLHALKVLYGMEKTYSDVRRLANISTLRERRVEACEKCAAKCATRVLL